MLDGLYGVYRVCVVIYTATAGFYSVLWGFTEMAKTTWDPLRSGLRVYFLLKERTSLGYCCSLFAAACIKTPEKLGYAISRWGLGDYELSNK